MTTTSHVAVRKRLEAALRAHGADPEALERLAAELRDRRYELGYADSRNLMARERGAPVLEQQLIPPRNPESAAKKLLYDVESGTGGGTRKSFSAGTLLAVAEIYDMDPLAIARVLERSGRPRPAAPPPPPAVAPLPSYPLAEKDEVAGRPYADEWYPRLRTAEDAGYPDPDGDVIFPAGTWEETSWDRLRHSHPKPVDRLWVIAIGTGLRDEDRGRHGARTGLAARVPAAAGAPA